MESDTTLANEIPKWYALPLTQLYIAWLLLPEDLGRIKILLTFMTFGFTAGGLCLNVSALKLCSENRSPNDEAALFLKGWIYTLISSVAVYSLGAAWAALCNGIIIYIVLSVIFKNTLKSYSK